MYQTHKNIIKITDHHALISNTRLQIFKGKYLGYCWNKKIKFKNIKNITNQKIHNQYLLIKKWKIKIINNETILIIEKYNHIGWTALKSSNLLSGLLHLVKSSSKHKIKEDTPILESVGFHIKLSPKSKKTPNTEKLIIIA